MEGLIYAAIVGIWGALLVPHWLRRREEHRAAREVDPRQRVRVLARRRPTSAPHPAPPQVEGSPHAAAGTARRRPAGSPALRRRRVLLGLVTLTAASAVGAALGLLPGPGLVPAVVAVLGWLAVCRVAVRRAALAQAAGRPPRRRAPAGVGVGVGVGDLATAEDPGPVPAGAAAAAGTAGTVVDGLVGQGAAPTAEVLPAGGDAAPVRGAQGSGWQPVPVPLPTYVTAPKARRSIRTIDLTAPGAWTAGWTEGEPAAAGGDGYARSRAVGG